MFPVPHVVLEVLRQSEASWNVTTVHILRTTVHLLISRYAEVESLVKVSVTIGKTNCQG